MQTSKRYYLGLDMGTSSVGWAVTDDNYNLLKVKGKDLWGIREFEEAKVSSERRIHRTNRRRHQRELVRIGLLKYYFHDEIMKVDPYFYQRLENSKYHLEDKDEQVKTANGIFNDEDYDDKTYYKEYPTIFHLRSELIHNETEHDVRLVFLALLNMFKHRGHFLNAGLSTEENTRKMLDVYNEFATTVQETLGMAFPEINSAKQIEDILGSREFSRTKKAELLAMYLNVDLKDKRKYAFLKTICGLKANVELLFPDLIIGTDKKVEICFTDANYEEKIFEIEDAIGEENHQIIELMREIFNIGSLSNIMKGYEYLSDARVAEYNKHADDLKMLKMVYKKYKTEEEYTTMFRSEQAGTYSAYVNSYNAQTGKQRRDMKGRTRDDLYKTIKNHLKKINCPDQKVEHILNEIEKENFLPKQLTSANGVIPNQVHAKEMLKILNNAQKYLSFLSDVDESGLTTSQRILKLFSFQIPYYIGPVSANSALNGGNGWVVRKEEGRVLPWNIEEKIDIKKTSEEFISRMVRRCSYMGGRQVLPKASLEYEAFCVLNEINNLRIDGERIAVELKQEIYQNLFEKGKKVTRKQIFKYLNNKGLVDDDSQISGIDISINNSLSTYGKFKAVFGDYIQTDKCKKMVEKIVFWCTVYGDSKKFLRDQLEENYKEDLSDEQIKRILGFKFKDWGRMSKEFLELPGCDKATGEIQSLIRTMWDTNYNLMELLNHKQYTFKEEFENNQTALLKTLSDIRPDDLNEYYFSAPVKRMIWQTILIIKELQHILGSAPARLFVEMTRRPDEVKQRTISRKNKLLELYKNESKEWNREIEKADENGTLKSKKIYLYFTQMGKCMYTGKTIDLHSLLNDNRYDIDHIYPRHFVKDDNIENNLVLVDKEENARKSDNYPLDSEIYISQLNMWRELLRKKLITEEKFKRLTSRKPFTEEQKAGFIARQLVETSQGVKGVTSILKEILPEPETKIVYSKASNVSDFRKKFDIVKCRSVNEFHHAHDAYLNIVVGNSYFVKFTQNPLNFILKEYARDEKKYAYNLGRMFDWNIARGDETAWISQKNEKEHGTITLVKKTIARNTPLMTRLCFENHGGLANETLYSASKAKEDGYMPLKATDEKMQDVKKYGGYSSVTTAYFFLVEHTKKKERIRTLETVPLYLKEKVEKNPAFLGEYCKEVLGLVDPNVRIAKIKMQSLVKVNGYFMYISGRSDNTILMRNAVNLCLQSSWMKYIRAIEKFIEKNILDGVISKERNEELYLMLVDKYKKKIYLQRPNSLLDKLEKHLDSFKDEALESQCNILFQIIKSFAIGTGQIDLSKLGEGSNVGKLRIGKNISGTREFKLIHQSVTGVYEQSIDLLTI